MNHLLHRETLELRFSSQEEARRWSPRLSDINRRVILPVLEEVFSAAAGGRRQLRIDRLEIDLGTLAPGELERGLAGRLRKEAAAALRRFQPLPDSPAPSAVPRGLEGAQTAETPAEQALESLGGASLAEAFSLFFRTGRFPWWLDRELAARIDPLYRQLWRTDPEAARLVVLSALAAEGPRRRFVLQLSEKSLEETLQRLAAKPMRAFFEDVMSLAAALPAGRRTGMPKRAAALEALFALIPEIAERPTAPLRPLARRFFVELARLRRVEIDRMQDAVETASGLAGPVSARAWLPGLRLKTPDAAAAGSRSGPAPDESRRTEAVTAGPDPTPEPALETGVDNAGLVLLWPHLKSIFMALNLLRGPARGPKRPRTSAVLLLEQLAFGRPSGREDRLALNKVLCGMAPDAPVPRRRRRSKKWDAEVEALLRAVISQWTALKRTSPEGFQGAFLQREGILRQQDHGWHLRVERKAFDILLEHLPWGIHTIQLSWMPAPLLVEW